MQAVMQGLQGEGPSIQGESGPPSTSDAKQLCYYNGSSSSFPAAIADPNQFKTLLPKRDEPSSSCTPIRVFAMLPLDTVNAESCFKMGSAPWFKQALALLAASGVHGVAVDVWWGAVERSPCSYSWGGYRQLVQLVKQAGLKMQAVMSFHACGGNTGDTAHISLPPWVLQCGEQDPDLFFTDRPRGGGRSQRNKEYLSIWASEARSLCGRSAYQCYEDFMKAFRDEFAEDLGSTIAEVVVGAGPCGELRFPSYPECHGWRFPGIGEFQCYDRRALAMLAQAAKDAGHPEWGYGGPHDSGQYNSNPEDTGFFVVGGSWDTAYGRFFLNWYSGSLLKHGERLLQMACNIFSGCLSVSTSSSGHHMPDLLHPYLPHSMRSTSETGTGSVPTSTAGDLQGQGQVVSLIGEPDQKLQQPAGSCSKLSPLMWLSDPTPTTTRKVGMKDEEVQGRQVDAQEQQGLVMAAAGATPRGMLDVPRDVLMDASTQGPAHTERDSLASSTHTAASTATASCVPSSVDGFLPDSSTAHALPSTSTTSATTTHQQHFLGSQLAAAQQAMFLLPPPGSQALRTTGEAVDVVMQPLSLATWMSDQSSSHSGDHSDGRPPVTPVSLLNSSSPVYTDAIQFQAGGFRSSSGSGSVPMLVHRDMLLGSGPMPPLSPSAGALSERGSHVSMCGAPSMTLVTASTVSLGHQVLAGMQQGEPRAGVVLEAHRFVPPGSDLDVSDGGTFKSQQFSDQLSILANGSSTSGGGVSYSGSARVMGSNNPSLCGVPGAKASSLSSAQGGTSFSLLHATLMSTSETSSPAVLYNGPSAVGTVPGDLNSLTAPSTPTPDDVAAHPLSGSIQKTANYLQPEEAGVPAGVLLEAQAVGRPLMRELGRSVGQLSISSTSLSTQAELADLEPSRHHHHHAANGVEVPGFSSINPNPAAGCGQQGCTDPVATTTGGVSEQSVLAGDRNLVTLSLKIPGVHWWFKSRSHAAELTAGYYNTATRDGYAPIVELCAKYGVTLTLTCVEMCDGQHPALAFCSPEGLLKQIRSLTARYNVKLSGENALPIFLSHGIDTVAMDRIVINTRAWYGPRAFSAAARDHAYLLALQQDQQQLLQQHLDRGAPLTHHASIPGPYVALPAEPKPYTLPATSATVHNGTAYKNSMYQLQGRQVHHSISNSNHINITSDQALQAGLASSQGGRFVTDANPYFGCVYNALTPACHLGCESTGGMGRSFSDAGQKVHQYQQNGWTGGVITGSGGTQGASGFSLSEEVRASQQQDSRSPPSLPPRAQTPGPYLASYDGTNSSNRTRLSAMGLPCLPLGMPGQNQGVAACGLRTDSYADILQPLPSMRSFTFLRLGPELLLPGYQAPWLRFVASMQQGGYASV